MGHFFKISIRRLIKDRFYTVICIVSLALGIACSLTIALYLYSELTFDHYHENHQRIYRINADLSSGALPKAYPLTSTNYRESSYTTVENAAAFIEHHRIKSPTNDKIAFLATQ